MANIKLESSISGEKIDQDNWAVSLLRTEYYGEHALIAVEGVVQYGNYARQWLWICDFVPKGWHLIKGDLDATGEGEIRSFTTDKIVSADQGTTWVFIRDNLSVKPGSNNGCQVWVVPKALAKRLQDNVEAQKATLPHPTFYGRGRGYGLKKVEGHNCTSWAEEKLSTNNFDINKSITAKLVATFYATAPSTYVPPGVQNNTNTTSICTLL